MAARQRIPLTMLDAGGAPRVGVSATIKRRATGAGINVYSTETGAGTLANPGAIISAADGRFPGWVPRDSLVATVSGGGLPAPTDIEFESNPGSQSVVGYVQAFGTALVYLNNNTWNGLKMDTEVYDPDSVFIPSATPANTYYTIPQSGFYHFMATVAFSTLLNGANRTLGFWATTTAGTGGAADQVWGNAADSLDSTAQAPVETIVLERYYDVGQRVYPVVNLSSGSGSTTVTLVRLVAYQIGIM